MQGDVGAVPDLYFRPAALADLDRVAELEEASYPEDEAATRSKLEYRIAQAPDLFLTAVAGSTDTIVGYCCGTLSTSDGLTHESMDVHEDEGRLLCIHSVCVAEGHRRQGIALKLLRTYATFVQQSRPDLVEIRLICKEPLVELYSKAGFEVVGPSPVVHGSDPWIEMMLKVED